jgi:hypothetical protein
MRNAKLPECDRCQRYSHSPYLVCAIHPSGPVGESCLDFAPVVGALNTDDDLWQPVGASTYAGELVPDVSHYLTTEERWELIETHPLFTGHCPSCGAEFDERERVYFDCESCGWKDDSI